MQNLEEYQHQIFLENLDKTQQVLDNQKKLQQMEILNLSKEKDYDR